MTKPRLRKTEVAFDGALITAKDPGTIKANDFAALVNMRYIYGGIESIQGMDYFGTNGLTNYPVCSDMIQHTVDLPDYSDSLILTVSEQSDGTDQIVGAINASTLPTGTALGWNSAALFTATDTTSNVPEGRLSEGPGNTVIFCNEGDTAIFYGSRAWPSKVIGWNGVDGSDYADYTDQLTNSGTSAEDIATLSIQYQFGIDASTALLLDFEGDFADSSGNSHTFVNGGGAVLGSTPTKFGSNCYFDNATSTSYIYASGLGTDTHWDLSGGVWTIDAWVYPTVTSGNPGGTIYSQQLTTASGYYTSFDLLASGTADTMLDLRLTVVSSVGTTSLLQVIGSNCIPLNTWSHVAAVENGNSYWLFMNGLPVALETSTIRPDTGSTDPPYIGAANYTGTPTNRFTGYIDELRLSNGAARYEGFFFPPTYAYGTTSFTDLYIGSPLPIRNVWIDVETANASAATVDPWYWTGSTWGTAALSSDQTSVGGKTLATSGLIQWLDYDNWDPPAQQRFINDVFLYWMKLTFKGIDATTQISGIKERRTFQQIQELWDGVYRSSPSSQLYITDGTNVGYNNVTGNLLEDTYDNYNEATYAKLGGFTYASDALYISSVEKASAFKLNVMPGFSNTDPCTMVVQYWDGDGWTSVSGLYDGTSEAGVSLAKSGFIYFNYSGISDESKTTLKGATGGAIPDIPKPTAGRRWTPGGGGGWTPGGGFETEETRKWREKTESIKAKATAMMGHSNMVLYYYKITWVAGGASATMTPTESLEINTAVPKTGVHLFFCGVVPRPTTMRGHKFAALHDGRLWLFGSMDREFNKANISSYQAPQILNGEDTNAMWFGDQTPCVAAASFTNQFGANLVKTMVVVKQVGVWRVVGEFPYEQHLISATEGCVAAKTMQVCDVEIAQGIGRKIAVWLSQRGVVYSDGNSVQSLSADISDVFDPNHPNYMGAAAMSACVSLFDTIRQEYHLIDVTNTIEYVYSFVHKKWFHIDRPANMNLSAALMAHSTSGIAYPMACGNGTGGRIWLLESGPDFLGSAINNTVKTPIISLAENYITEETVVRGIKLIQLQDAAASSTVVTHFPDSKTSGTTFDTMGLTRSGYLYKDTAKIARYGPHIFHQFQFYMSSLTLARPWSPKFFSILWEYAREDVRA